mmetsp:Transcript_12375/g.26947  ORF Transcript_12375/g.26947 Transcript_12375/m.26947 type:complete len:83 (+) Transcript_12375:247-495(+)
MELLIKVKSQVLPWIRLNRVVRDIPSQNILGGNSNVSLRQVILSEMDKRGLKCPCMRCREVKSKQLDQFVGTVVMRIREYNC